MAAEPDTTTASRASAREQIRMLLLKDLARNFTYPLIARRRGWEGKVLLAVTLQSNGKVAHVRITQSSGFDILDRSAANTLQNVGQLADAAPWLHGQTLELLLPVVYRLTD
jgi:protein TonB